MNLIDIVFYLAAAICFSLAIPVAVTGILTCRNIHRGNDPARRGFTWLKGAYVFMFLTYFMSGVGNLLAGLRRDSIIFIGGTIMNAITLTADVCSCVGDAFLIMTLIELGNGFDYALTLQKLSLHKLWRIFGSVFSGLIIVLAVSASAYSGWLRSHYFSTGLSESAYLAGIRRGLEVSAAGTVFVFVATLGSVVQASLVRYKYTPDLPATNSAVLYLVAGILNLVPRNLWKLIFSLSMLTESGFELIEVEVALLADTICNHVVAMIILTLLFILGKRTSTGLWTTKQSWTNDILPSTVEAPESYHGTAPTQTGDLYPQNGGGWPLPQQAYDQSRHWQYVRYQQPVETGGAPINEVSGGETAFMMPNTPEGSVSPQKHTIEQHHTLGKDQVVYEKE